MRETILTELTAWLAAAPCLAGIRAWQIDDAGPMPWQGGVFPAGVTVTARRQDLCGGVTLRCRAAFVVRLALPQGRRAQNAALLLALQDWVARQSAARAAPAFGNAEFDRETLSAGEGRLERAEAAGVGIYAVRLTADYTEYDKEEQP